MMHIKSSPTTPLVAGEKRPKKESSQPQDTRKVSSFIQRFYLFGNSPSTPHGAEAEPEAPKVKKTKVSNQQTTGDTQPNSKSAATARPGSSPSTDGTVSSSSEPSEELNPVQYPSYSVQRLRQFWNNRLLSNQQPTGSSIDTLVRKAKSATIGAPTGAAARTVLRKSPSPKATTRFQRNGSITRSGRRRFGTLDSTESVRSGLDVNLQRSAQPPKRSSHAALLSPDREAQRTLVEKRPCVGSTPVTAGPSARESFPLAVSTPNGNQIHWARRTELLGIRALTQEEKKQCAKMPLRVENYVNSYIDVDIQSVGGQDEPTRNVSVPVQEPPKDALEKLPPIPNTSTPVTTPVRQPSTSSLGRKGNTPTRKISFMNNISPYNRKLLACNGTKVAALTSKFNQMIQQDAGLLAQVQKRGGYLHKCGNVAYKVIEDPGSDGVYGFTSTGRMSSARSSLRKKHSNASATSGGGSTAAAATATATATAATAAGTAGNRTDESSDEISSSASSKNSSLRKTGLRKRPSLRKNIYRRPEWETGRSSLGVRKVLEMFEPNLHHGRGKRAESGDTGKPPPGRSKPKVPDKSEQVLQKTKDFKSKKVVSEVVEKSNRGALNEQVEEVRGDVATASSADEHVVDGSRQETNDSSAVSEEAKSNDVSPKEAKKGSNGITSKLHKNSPREASNAIVPSKGENLEPTEVLSDGNNSFGEIHPSHNWMDGTYDQIDLEEPTNGKEISAVSKPNEIISSQKVLKEKEKSKSAVSKIQERLTFRSSKKVTVENTAPRKEPSEGVANRSDHDLGEDQAAYSSVEKGSKQVTEEPSPYHAVKTSTGSNQELIDVLPDGDSSFGELHPSYNWTDGTYDRKYVEQAAQINAAYSSVEKGSKKVTEEPSLYNSVKASTGVNQELIEVLSDGESSFGELHPSYSWMDGTYDQIDLEEPTHGKEIAVATTEMSGSQKDPKEKEKGKSAVSKIQERLTFRSSKKVAVENPAPRKEPSEEVANLSDNDFGENHAEYSFLEKGSKQVTEEPSPHGAVQPDSSQTETVVTSPKEGKEKKRSKSTVSKIYERLTFRSSKKMAAPSERSDEVVIIREAEDANRKAPGLRRSFVSSIEIPSIHPDERAVASPSPEASREESTEKDSSEQKILEAISAVSQRIDNLSKSFSDLTLTDDENTQAKRTADAEQEEDVQQVRPNASFLFRGMGSAGSRAGLDSKHASQHNIVEAVNTVVINKSLSMDDHHFPCARGETGRMSLNERSRAQRGLEDDYEPVIQPEEKLPSAAGSKFCSTPSITIDLSELTSKIESFVHKSKRESDNIYQSIPIKSQGTGNTALLHQPEDAISVNSYESFENYESIEHELLSSTRKQNPEKASGEEDTYEICSPPPELPPAREDSRNDLTLPQPKRNLSSSPKTLPKHLQVTYQSNYERIKYSKIPPRPPKPEEVPLPPRNSSTASTGATSSAANVTLEASTSHSSSTEQASSGAGGDLLDKSPHRQERIYEENIYDTIRSADGVDYDDPACGSAELDPTQTTQPGGIRVGLSSRARQQPSPPADNVSLVSSNCYESIGLRLEYERSMMLARRNLAGGSTTTLASDQITNSLYGVTAGLASLTPPSERGSDTSNSADWTDISDEDETGERADVTTAMTTGGSKRPNFIVVRERKRTHQTPLRSRKLARISHPKIDDDSDHHYESLYSIGSNDGRHQHQHDSNYTTLPSHAEGSPLSGNVTSGVNFHEHRAGGGGGGDASAAMLLPPDDEFDSFDSDDTDYEDEDDDRNRARTDSGVDIRNAKLPDPPPSSSQVYVLVQKIKNLGTLSEIAKSFHKLSKKKGTKGATTTAGAGGGTYENTVLGSKHAGTKTGSKGMSSSTSSKSFKLPPLPLVGGGGGVPKPPPEDYEGAAVGSPHSGSHPAPPGSSLLLPASSPSLSSASTTANRAAAATPLISSPVPEQSSSAGVRSTSESSNVSGNVPKAPGTAGFSPADGATRKKSKSTKSLRSKLRKSLVSDSTSLNIGSSFNGSRSTFYVTSADVDSGIFNGSDGCLNPSASSVSQSQEMPTKPAEDNRRKSIASATGTTGHGRPTIPPPPPPAEAGKRTAASSSVSPLLAASNSKSVSKKLGATSWYAECGVFKQPHSFGTGSDQSLSNGKGDGSISPRSSLPPKDGGPTGAGSGGGVGGGNDRTLTSNGHTSASSWYADIYQTSGASVASSSESSGVSTGGEGGPGDDHSHSMFVNEPLYQIYNAAKLESITRDIDAEISGRSEAELYDDGYEKIAERNRRRKTGGTGEQEGAEEGDEGGCSSSSGSSSTDGDDRGDDSAMHLRKPSRPTALELIEPHIGKLRTLWCEVPEVRNSEILATLTPTEKRLQEAKFEILTSEASYLKSLNLLRTHFVNHPAFRDTRILSSSERKTLFSSIIPVQECSDRLLCDLENCWQDNIMLLGLSHSIYKHAEKHFHVYVTYCEHQAKIDRTLKALKANKPEFARTLAALEADPVCCSLSLSSFLMLPMQRITRMRLLLDAVLQRCHPDDDDEFGSWESTFVLINRILTQCNDAAHRSEQLYEMELLSRQIEFPTNVRPLAIVPCGIGAAPSTMHRKLEKRGDLVHVLWRGDDAKLTFGKKFSKSNVYAFLFTDLLVLTKKKSDESYLVIDYCQRALLTVSSGDIVTGLPAKEMQTIGKNLIIMTLLENHEGKTIEMILSCPSETERERWLMVTEPPASENPDEKIYEQWDCPQVIAVHPYQALQPDELDLDIKDVVNVHRKMADGWYEGERIRDGAVGWFPSNYTKEIPSAHIRAKHIKQRHLLLTYTSKYIDTATKAHHHYHNYYHQPQHQQHHHHQLHHKQQHLQHQQQYHHHHQQQQSKK
uniref:DH domain-containing protein n=1 Tax=Anopheles coluzzii TaxID=1518534 RepID=A0A6E8VSI7_ANOCL